MAGATYSLSTIPSISCGNGCIDGLLRDALGIALLGDDDLLHRIVDDLLHSALFNALLDLSLGVNASQLIDVAASTNPRLSTSDLEKFFQLANVAPEITFLARWAEAFNYAGDGSVSDIESDNDRLCSAQVKCNSAEKSYPL